MNFPVTEADEAKLIIDLFALKTFAGHMRTSISVLYSFFAVWAASNRWALNISDPCT